MLDVWRIKKTKQIVYPVGAAVKGGYTDVILPFDGVTRAGNRATILTVKNDNLMKDREI